MDEQYYRGTVYLTGPWCRAVCGIVRYCAARSGNNIGQQRQQQQHGGMCEATPVSPPHRHDLGLFVSYIYWHGLIPSRYYPARIMSVIKDSIPACTLCLITTTVVTVNIKS